MPHGKQTKKNAPGAGTIRKKTVLRNGKEYSYWEARFTVGFDPGTGKQKQKSVTGKTQKEVAQKLRQITNELDRGTYLEPCKMTLGQWLDIWQKTYLGSVKPRTVEAYQSDIKNHIKPAMGAIKLEALNTPDIQAFYNRLFKPEAEDVKPLSPKTIRLIHGILHKSLQQAVAIGYLRFNPTEACSLPRVEHKELKPMDDIAISRFMAAVQGHPYEAIFLVTLFTGMRKGEVLGLTWDHVDFARGTLLVNQQLQRLETGSGRKEERLVSTKNSKGRQITPAPFVMDALRRQWKEQALWRLQAGPSWQETGLVFTDQLGDYLPYWNVYRDFKRLAAEIGLPSLRFHDLRHSYAVAAIRAGDDIKTVQGNLGHATAAFTLDVYGHVTDQMKQASAARMEDFIKRVSGQ